MSEWRDLLFTEGRTDRDRTVAAPLQYRAIARVAGLQAAGAGGLCPSGYPKTGFAALCGMNSLTTTSTKLWPHQCGAWRTQERAASIGVAKSTSHRSMENYADVSRSS